MQLFNLKTSHSFSSDPIAEFSGVFSGMVIATWVALFALVTVLADSSVAVRSSLMFTALVAVLGVTTYAIYRRAEFASYARGFGVAAGFSLLALFIGLFSYFTI